MADNSYQADVAVIGGGVAGIITALELLDAGRSVVLADSDTSERFGGLARWAFGGMALVGTPQQKRLGIDDSPELALEDWIRFGELDDSECWPLAWARCYVNESRSEIYDWLVSRGLKFMPAVNLVERGEFIKGNSVPRYHILWGTGQGLVERLAGQLLNHRHADRLKVLHGHRVTELESTGGGVAGCRGSDPSGQTFRLVADRTVIATGGVNGTVENVRRHWPEHWKAPPEVILNGAHPHSDGLLHQQAAGLGARLTHLSDMWNYAAGIPHPQAHFPGHGLSLIPCKTSLWLSPDGEPLGPAPMVSGFDTHQLCRQVAEHPYTWQVMNRRIACKELAISGSQHNPRIRDGQFIRFVLDTLLGSSSLLDRMLEESVEFVTAGSVGELAQKMNELTGERRIDGEVLQRQVVAFDADQADPETANPVVQRIRTIREWKTDRLRTCDNQPIGDPKAGPLLAIRLHFISRKSLGGLQTDLQCRVRNAAGEPVPGLFAVGEAAGFGGGGASGRRSLEGTFLSGCVLTARKAAAAMAD
jgi:predicted oxidoreductase